MGMCVLCGVRTAPGEGHEDSERHQVAEARLVVAGADGVPPRCPYCAHSKRPKPCRDADHAQAIREARALVAAKT